MTTENQVINIGSNNIVIPEDPREMFPCLTVLDGVLKTEKKLLKTFKWNDAEYKQRLALAQEHNELFLDWKVKQGQFLAELPKAQGIRNDLTSPTEREKLGKSETLKKLGITTQRASRLQTIAANPKAVEKAKKIAIENEDTVSESLVLQIIKEDQREEKRANIIAKQESLAATEVEEPTGSYDVLVADLPYPMKKIERDVAPTQVELDYPTMSEEELRNLELPAADDCHLWLWTTHKYLPMALRLLEHWGFKYICTFVWHKNGGYQPFGLPQYNCEFALYAHKGNPHFIDLKQFFTCFDADRTKHSEKPEAFYDVVRRVTAGRRLDMFARRKIDGFDSWGNEAAK